MTVSILVCVHGQLAFTRRCLEAVIAERSPLLHEIVIVDNASLDDTAAYLADLAAREQLVRVVSPGSNLGFVGGNNLAASHATGDLLLFLNNDTEQQPGSLKALVDRIEGDPTVGAVGAKLVSTDGTLQEAGGIIFSDGSGWNYGRGDDPHRSLYTFAREVDYCSAACLLVRRETFDALGGFDERYAPAYYEDTDLCFGIRTLGLRVVYEPRAVVLHHEGATAGTDVRAGAKRHQIENSERFRAKWAEELTRQHPPNHSWVGPASNRAPGARVRIDPFAPMYDPVSGSRSLFDLLRLIAEEGHAATFVARDGYLPEHYLPALERLGVEVSVGMHDDAEATAAIASARADEATRRAAAAESLAKELVHRATEAEAVAGEFARRATTSEAAAEEAKQALAEAESERETATDARVTAATAEVELLRREIELAGLELERLRAIEASTTWRVTRPIRAVLARLPLRLRLVSRRGLAAIRRRIVGLMSRFRGRGSVKAPAPGAGSTDLGPIGAPATIAAQLLERSERNESPGGGEPRALIVDTRWPEPDRDAGSLDAMNFIESLISFGYVVTFFATDDASSDHYRLKLRDLGVLCLSAERSGPLERFLEHSGGDLDLVVLSRVHSGGPYLEQIRRLAGTARLIFSTVDLHFVREEREANLASDRAATFAAAATRERELYIVRQADATFVVSAEEHRLLQSLVPGALVVHLPLAQRLHQPATGYAERSGIGFVGGFAHTPNVDAVRFFLADIWPIVSSNLPDCEFSIVGQGLPAEIERELPPRTRYLGQLPELAPWLDGVRLTVAPLRYGAGAKGKIATSLVHGVPCVGTPLALEGMGIRDGVEILVGRTPVEFADRVAALYRDPDLWERMSEAALGFGERELTPERWRERFADVLRELALPATAAATPAPVAGAAR